MAGTEQGILQALSGSLLGSVGIHRECFLEEYDSDEQQQQWWPSLALIKWPHQTYTCFKSAKEVPVTLQLLCRREPHSPAAP